MKSTNPATGETVETYDEHTESDVDDWLSNAETAFESWRDRPMTERETKLAAVATLLRERTEEYAELMTREMGKPISQAEAEVEKCAWVCDHYAENAGRYLQDEQHPSPPGSSVKTVHEPLGPVLAVMPWRRCERASPTRTRISNGYRFFAGSKIGPAKSAHKMIDAALGAVCRSLGGWRLE